MPGYHIVHNGDKCSSVRTHIQDSGAFEFFVNLQAGPDVERHLHGFAQVTEGGLILSMGGRIKNQREQYLTPHVPLQPRSTEELARFVIETGPGGKTAHFSKVVNEEWVQSGPGHLGGSIYREQIDLPTRDNAQRDEYLVLFYDARTPPEEFGADTAVLPFTSDIPFGIALQRVPSSSAWSGGSL